MTSALWNNLLEAFGETMLAGVLFVTLFSLGVRTLSRNHASAVPDPGSPAQAPGSMAQVPGTGSAPQAQGSPAEGVTASEAGAVLCFVLCFLIVALGVYLAATK
jgi:hypothetical protein